MKNLREFLELLWANLEYFLDTKLDVLFRLWLLFVTLLLFPAALAAFQVLLNLLSKI